jgi:hypothetical protein
LNHIICETGIPLLSQPPLRLVKAFTPFHLSFMTLTQYTNGRRGGRQAMEQIK